jgi:methyl halide transferase
MPRERAHAGNGCGTGTNVIFLAQHGFNVLGVDISEVAVDKARAKAHGR